MKKFWRDLRMYVFSGFGFAEGLANLRRIVWNKRIKLWWYGLYIRKNEFHVSLEADFDAMIVMVGDEIEDYYRELARRRFIAHNRSIVKENQGE